MKWPWGRSAKQNKVSTPVILQMEASECGATALDIILAYYGVWVPLEKMRQNCGVSRDGVSAGNIVKAARRYGCTAVGYRWSAEALKSKNYPLILHWEFNHFLVLEGFNGNRVYLNDPAVGHRNVDFAEFRTSYTGITLCIRPGEAFKKLGRGYSVVRVLSQKLLAEKWSTAFILIVCACLFVPNLITPVFGQIFLDDILTGKHRDWTFNLLLAMGITFVVQAILVWLRAWCLTRWQTKLTLADSSRFFWHVLQLPMEFFQQRFGAEVASRVSFNEAIASVLTGPAATAVLDLLIALFYLFLLFQYNVTLTLIGISFSLLGAVVFFGIRQRLLEMTLKVQQDTGKAYGAAMYGLLTIESLKANGNEAAFFTKWAGYKTRVLAGQQKVTLYNLTMQILPLFLIGLNTALIMTVGGFAIMDGLMTAGIFMAFQKLMGNFQTPFSNLLNLADSLQTTEMQMKRLDDVLSYEKDQLNYPDQEVAYQGEARLYGEVCLDDVSFGYSMLQPPLLEHFQLHLLPGHWVALVGSSGSGKSTVAKLVSGLYQQWSGKVLFDQQERQLLPHEVICNSVASVNQDIFLFSGTIEENLTLFDKSIRHDDVVKAAKDACIHEDILKLDGGYDAAVSEGGFNFSGGQRQRLEIARALAVNPSILILDEATSALDPLTEQQVMENIRRRGCSCLVVAHRLSTIRDCDEIIVIKRGVIVERGRHQDLIKAGGAYQQLIMDQLDLPAKGGKPL